jgi:hypothetical protein
MVLSGTVRESSMLTPLLMRRAQLRGRQRARCRGRGTGALGGAAVA